MTVLAHPDIDRIGERVTLPALLRGDTVELSRGTPEFARPGEVWEGGPLADSFVSRQPLLLRAAGEHQVTVHRGTCKSPVRIEGDALGEERTFGRVDLELGVVLELADRVALLLHLVPEDRVRARLRSRDHGMVGESAALLQVRATIERLVDVHVPVLLRGESGTGKELVARALHRSSPRAKKPFVPVNLGAIPPTLAASELFGNAKGAYTGAVAAGDGYFRAAEKGTLFLDEVGEAPAEVQVMLLRALESGEIYPVGSRQARRVDVRLVAATDSNLERRVQDGSFREPLLHRLAAYEIYLPPLRERRDDLGRLFVHFARQELKELGEVPPSSGDSPQTPWIPAALLGRLTRYPWPGNVRELRNVVRQIVIDSRGEAQLCSGERVERLLARLQGRDTRQRSQQIPAPSPAGSANRKGADLSDEEVLAAMRAADFELAAAARALGVTRPSLYNRVRRHAQLRLAEDIPEDELRHVMELHDGAVVAAAQGLKVSARALARRWQRVQRRVEKGVGTDEY